ncbi:hypothetical protein [Phytomonospora endophytica]|uniref:PE domain-containing protein n=1 Tax=Phytomonospora endophytica TaxID=714109 RepID=A0A841FRL6_9ACTN|nr:hypothetical protein [Phytomonospora endophytica]MBB6034600.1 hypothetical protein [Phytomonospora endophytica]GIG71340.1 hypothetical protein Pen01_76350 [Phytomonospora endophytica]
MTGFQVDIGGIDGAGKVLQDVATSFGEALSRFQAELNGYNRPWGDNDDLGGLIGAAHDEVSEYAFECYQDALDEISSAGVDLSEMAEKYRIVEEAADGDFTRFHQKLGG